MHIATGGDMNIKSIAGMFAALILSDAVLADRYVVVNGNRLNPQQITELENIHCGPVPNGNFWVNPSNGMWGYAGDPKPKGHVTDTCDNPKPRPRLSETGILFGPSNWGQGF
jgi:hypothetical protein